MKTRTTKTKTRGIVYAIGERNFNSERISSACLQQQRRNQQSRQKNNVKEGNNIPDKNKNTDKDNTISERNVHSDSISDLGVSKNQS